MERAASPAVPAEPTMCNAAGLGPGFMGPLTQVASLAADEHGRLSNISEERTGEDERPGAAAADQSTSSSAESGIVINVDSSTTDSSSTSIEPSLGQGVCGLRNLGNTCFMNAGLQCLINMPAICDHFFRNHQSEQEKSDADSVVLTKPFRDLLFEIWSTEKSMLQPTIFKNHLGTKYTQFSGFRQQDCQEFLALLLSCLHEELNAKSSPDSPLKSQESLQSSTTKDTPEEDTPMEVDNPGVGPRTPDLSPIQNLVKDNKVRNTNMTQSGDENESNQNIHFDSDKFAKDKDRRIELTTRNPISPNRVSDNDIGKSPGSDDTDELNDALSSNNNNNNFVFCSNEKPTSNSPSNKKGNDDSVDDDFSQQGSPSGSMKKMKLEDGAVLDIKDSNNMRYTQLNNGPCAGAHDNHIQGIMITNSLESDNSDTPPQPSSQLASQPRPDKITNLEAAAAGGSVPDGVNVTGAGSVQGACKDADTQWDRYIAENRSVIADTFQGQFKSSICCSHCNHVSVTYEPFMYLPVPLPRALDRQVEVVHVPADVYAKRIRYLLTVNKHGVVGDLRTALGKAIGKADKMSDILFAAGQTSSIDRHLEDSVKLTYLTPTNTSTLFAFEPSTSHVLTDSAAGQSEERMGDGTEGEGEHGGEKSGVSGVQFEVAKSQSCQICMEDFYDTDLLLHPPCGVTLCSECLDRSVQHHSSSPTSAAVASSLGESTRENVFTFGAGEEAGCSSSSGSAAGGSKEKERFLQCPICLSRVRIGEFVPVREKPAGSDSGQSSEAQQPTSRILMLTVLFRYERPDKSTKTFSEPRVTYVRDKLPFSELYNHVRSTLLPKDSPSFLLRRTDTRGNRCSQCFQISCECSLLPECDEQCSFAPGDCVTVCFPVSAHVDVPPAIFAPITDDASMSQYRPDNDLSLHECVEAFTEGETLDESWNCPKCATSRAATKQIQIWRPPKLLVIYLKRFYFDQMNALKIDSAVSCPQELNMSPYLLNSEMEPGAKFTLQSCVCHFGSVNFGHYTAFAKNPVSDKWYYFNDDTVTLRTPCEDDNKDIYILFYQRDDCVYDLSVPDKALLSASLKEPAVPESETSTSTSTTITASSPEVGPTCSANQRRPRSMSDSDTTCSVEAEGVKTGLAAARDALLGL